MSTSAWMKKSRANASISPGSTHDKRFTIHYPDFGRQRIIPTRAGPTGLTLFLLIRAPLGRFPLSFVEEQCLADQGLHHIGVERLGHEEGGLRTFTPSATAPGTR